MASTPKKPRLDPTREAIAALDRTPVKFEPVTEEELHRLFKNLTVGLRADAGLIGNDEEELDYSLRQFYAQDDALTDEDGGDDDDEVYEDSDDLDQEQGDGDFVLLTDDANPEGKRVPVQQYFGSEWEEMIVNLHSVKPYPVFHGMPTTPHDYQLKGAAQIDFLCKSPFRGCLVGDPMGLGKTLQAIISMKAIQDEPGLILVICPATLCRQWVDCIHGAFEDNHGLAALHVNDPSLTVHQILAGRYDVLVCSFEFADTNINKLTMCAEEIKRWRKADDATQSKPGRGRPTASIASSFWSMIGLPFKRCYVDEAQQINKRDKKRHKSIMQLPVQSWCLMSGTLAHNRWDDISGYLDFIQGHPYTTSKLFQRQFCAKKSGKSRKSKLQIDDARMSLLQRFLQAFIILRPRNALKLPPCQGFRAWVELEANHAIQVSEMTSLYLKCAGMDDGTEDQSVVGLAIQAQIHSLHPYFAAPEGGEKFELDEEVITSTTAEDMNTKNNPADTNAAQKRAKWLERLDRWNDVDFDRSPHLIALTNLLAEMVTNAPQNKIVVISQYLKYLDIVDLVMRRRHKISCLSYNGTVAQDERVNVQKQFANLGKPRPLLMTAGAGSVGLNLTSATRVILVEEWWNSSVETQAISRCWRQGQTEEVKVVKICLANSAIDTVIERARQRKKQTNKDLMAPLIHAHDNVLKVVELRY